MDEVELEIAREQAKKAQREHEEKQQRKEELEKKREELERQRVELVERQRREREKLMEKIRRAEEKAKEKAKEKGKGVASAATSAASEETLKDGSESVTPPAPAQSPEKEATNGTSVPEQEAEEASERKVQLQKMLTDLQNQVPPPPPTLLTGKAKALNIPPSEYTLPPLSDTRTKTSSTFRGGSYRSRGYPPRSRGRGAGGSSRSLDLRPKSILVPAIVGTDAETSVREWVISNCADAVVETAPEDATALVVRFKERYEAEEVNPTPLPLAVCVQLGCKWTELMWRSFWGRWGRGRWVVGCWGVGITLL